MNVGIIGAGPRGVILTSQLLNQFKYNADQPENLTITLFDPYEIGGRIWRKDQWDSLIMNTPADQITLFTDASVNMTSKVYDGPSLFEWAASAEAQDYLTANDYPSEIKAAAGNLGGRDYAPRVLYGAYIRWFYSELMNQCPIESTVTVEKAEIVDLQYNANQRITLKTDDHQYAFDKVVMSLGQQDNYLNDEEQQLATYAQRNKLTYISPTHPGDANLNDIPAGEPVIIRGLGLSFYDYVSELTLGRGGTYMKNDDGSLSYQPTGREPRIVAGSQRGIPYYPKAISEKGYGEQAQPVFLTAANMDQVSVDGKLPFAEFMRLLKLDLDLVYYSLLIRDKFPYKSATDFKDRFINSDNRPAVLAAFGFQEEDIFDWDYIVNPFKDVQVIGTEDYQSVLINWLSRVIPDAEAGSKTGPTSSALELLRDFRPVFRKIIAEDRFSNEDYVNKFLGEFTSIISFLSVGAPVLRSEQLSALIRSGLVTILAPEMELKTQNGWYVTASPKRNTDVYKSAAVLEARVPKPDLTITANPLLENLVDNQLARTKTLKVNDQDVGLAAVDVQPDSDQLINKGGAKQPNVYIWGVPLEGLRFATNASPRPGVNDINLQTADKIAASVLGLKTADKVDMN